MRIEKLTWRGRLLYVLAALAIASVLIFTAVQTSSAQDPGGEMNGCYVTKGKQKGKFRMLSGTSTTCKSTETWVSWNEVGPAGPQGDQGIQGIQGLKGDQGIQGIQGDPGANGTDGINGINGTDGTDGINGTDGKTVLSGAGAPEANEGDDGDFYIDTTDNRIYGPKDGTWPVGYTSLVGPQGPQGNQGIQGVKGDKGDQGIQGIQGIQGDPGANGTDGINGTDGTDGTDGINGTDGKTVLNGTGAPTTQGSEGDFYIDTTAKAIYGPKGATTWPGTYTSLVGPQGGTGATGATGAQGLPGLPGATGLTGATGADGKTVLNGTSNPTSGTGNNGDFYINTSTNQIFGPKNAGAWPSGISLVGPQGAAGATNVTIRTGTVVTITNNNLGTATASCNAGEKATGGGYVMPNTAPTDKVLDTAIYQSQPTVSGSTMGWSARGFNKSGSNITLTAYVICAAP